MYSNSVYSRSDVVISPPMHCNILHLDELFASISISVRVKEIRFWGGYSGDALQNPIHPVHPRLGPEHSHDRASPNPAGLVIIRTPKSNSLWEEHTQPSLGQSNCEPALALCIHAHERTRVLLKYSSLPAVARNSSVNQLHSSGAWATDTGLRRGY